VTSPHTPNQAISPVAIYLALGPELEGDRAVGVALASQEVKAPSFPHSLVLIVLFVDESVAAQVTKYLLTDLKVCCHILSPPHKVLLFLGV